MKKENLELQSQLWQENYKSFIENERVASIEYDKHIFHFFILLITGLCYVFSQTYSSHPRLSLVFVVPIVPCVITIYYTLLLYRNNIKRLSHIKALYDDIFLFEKENLELSNTIEKLATKFESCYRWSWIFFNVSIVTIFTVFTIFYFAINLDKFQNTHTPITTNTKLCQ